MLAKRNGKRIECGKCGSLLAMRTDNTIYGVDVYQPGEPLLEIKCKSRKNGKTCDEINGIRV